MDGSAYKGERNPITEQKHGLGKMIDILGNLVIGKFKKNVFVEGFVINYLGHLYIVNFSPTQLYDIKDQYSLLKNPERDFKLKEDLEDWYKKCDPTEYHYPNKDLFFGTIDNYLPNGYGIKFLYKVKYILPYSNCYKKIIGTFTNGKVNGESILEMFFLLNKSKCTARVVFKNDEIIWIICFTTKNTIVVHNCSIEDAENHLCLILSESDCSVRFYGNTSLDFQNGLAYHYTGEFISLNSKKVKPQFPPQKPT